MDDLISRQAAIKAFKDFLTIHDSRGAEYLCSAVTMDGVNRILSDLPSAQPEHLVKESGNLVNASQRLHQQKGNDCISRKAAQKYVSVMEKIERVHALKNALPCFEFDFSFNPYLGFWYAEEGLYFLCDYMVDAYYFVDARSPHKAIEKVLKRVDEALHAGEPQYEEYE